MMHRAAGYSIVEALIAAAVALLVAGSAIALLNHAQASFASQPEAADAAQRLRVAAGALYTNLEAAGNGPDGGILTGSLLGVVAPVLPFRRGTRADDPAGTYFADRITLRFVPPAAPRARMAAGGLSLGADWIGAERQPQCTPDAPLCAFQPGTTIALADGTGNADILALTAIDTSTPMPLLQHAGQPLGSAGYRPNAEIVGMSNIAYVLNRATNQLETIDGVGATQVPLVDNVIALTFAYFGDPQPPQRTAVPLDNPSGPWTTYGPKPPPLDVQANPAWPPGENCVFAVAAGAHTPRLAALDGGPLVPLAAAQLTDGPWCPDPLSDARWDADLLRIRSIVVTVRIQAAIAALRGPAGALFATAGTGRDPARWVPDREITFRVSPRNLNLADSP